MAGRRDAANLRGGSWMSPRFQARSSERLHADPTAWPCSAGVFRYVHDPY